MNRKTKRVKKFQKLNWYYWAVVIVFLLIGLGAVGVAMMLSKTGTELRSKAAEYFIFKRWNFNTSSTEGWRELYSRGRIWSAGGFLHIQPPLNQFTRESIAITANNLNIPFSALSKRLSLRIAIFPTPIAPGPSNVDYPVPTPQPRANYSFTLYVNRRSCYSLGGLPINGQFRKLSFC